MYRLRQMNVDDKVCEQVTMTMLNHVYPDEVVISHVQQSAPWSTKRQRVRGSTALSLVLFLMAMGLWNRLNQCQVWQKLVGKLSDLHPSELDSMLTPQGLTNRRLALGSECLQTLMHRRCVVLASAELMPSAFFGRYRLMAIDGTLLRTADTPANTMAFGRSCNQFGPGPYPQVRCVLLTECGSHGVIELQIDRYDVSEVHAAHRLLEEVEANMLVMADAGIISGGFLEHARKRQAHVLGTLEAGAWENLDQQRRLQDGSVLAWVPASPRRSQLKYPLQAGMWVRIISYRLTDERLGEEGKVYRLVTTLLNPRVAPALKLIEVYHERWEIELVIDEIKTHEQAQRKVLRSKTPELVRQELYGIFLAHYAVRFHLAQAAMQAGLDPDRLSFTNGLFQLVEMIDLALILEPTQQSNEGLLKRLYHKMILGLLPPRRLRVNRREIKKVYSKYKPKKREEPPIEPFEPDDQFLDFVELLDPLALFKTQEVLK